MMSAQQKAQPGRAGRGGVIHEGFAGQGYTTSRTAHRRLSGLLAEVAR